MLCFRRLFRATFPFITMVIVIIAFHFSNFILLKYYPPIINFSFFIIFFSSCFREKTVIQQIALSMEPDADENVMRYTRKLTYVWSAFMLINFLISLATVFMSKEVWAIYNGFISYLLVGIFFGVEYIVRINFKRKYAKNRLH